MAVERVVGGGLARLGGVLWLVVATGWVGHAHAAPCAGFTDVDDASAFCVNVAWMKNRGITLGCTATLYCPSDYVTRLQMAAFMYRLGFQNAFLQGGNTFGAPAVLGTLDAQRVEILANNVRVMRYEPNAISPNVIGGSPANSVTPGVRGATIGGGGVLTADIDPDFMDEAPNRVTDAYGTVGGGYGNRAGDSLGSVTSKAFDTVGGGKGNTASGSSSTVGGGQENTARGLQSTVGGGGGNTASGDSSTVGGGSINIASGLYSTVGGGAGNAASGLNSTVAGGVINAASGTSSTVVGGYANIARGDYSVAMGYRAEALGDGSFSFADSNSFDFSSSTVNAFRVRATGGVRFVTDINGSTGATTWSCVTASGEGWSCSSDRNLKHSLVELDGQAVLAKLAALPVYQWQPKGKNAQVTHYGPMAQDFHAAFGLGSDDTMIGMQDADGVALAAIKGLNAKLESAIGERDRMIAAQAREMAEERAARQSQAREIVLQRAEIAELKRAVQVLLAREAADERLAAR